jgi:flavin-dependent dehydrogenase
MEPRTIVVIGGGPAGCAAALAALAEGASVTLYEKSRFPRHKVCGEFLSPEILPILESLHLQAAFLAARPARLARAVLHLGNTEKCIFFPEPAYSLSRVTLDRILLAEAVRRGAEMKTQTMQPPGVPTQSVVVAHGRQTPAPKGKRLFGFKAHFQGSVDDAVEMFFFRGCYAGVSSIEDGGVNVCGVAPEELLRPYCFQPEALFPESLRTLLRPLKRSFDWLITGPLVFHDKSRNYTGVYLAGDALGFVDPFTGSGIFSALLTGRLAGQSAASGVSIESYNAACRRMLRRQYCIASMVRRALSAGLAEGLARWIPPSALYRLTRPAL